MFRNENLAVIAYANGFTLWHYASKEKFEELLAPNYFDRIYDLSLNGDIIILTAADETGMRKMNLENGHVVLSNLS